MIDKNQNIFCLIAEHFSLLQNTLNKLEEIIQIDGIIFSEQY